MGNKRSLTEGNIFSTLIMFAIPVIAAMFLQGLYGAVDLIVVGQFGSTADVSGVSTGSQIMMTVTQFIAGLAMGVTVLVGQKIGQGAKEDAGRAIGSAVLMFLFVSLFLSVVCMIFASSIASLMNAPVEAFSETVSYLRICFGGLVFITAYNLVGSIFRGIGDSRTPLITVAISCFINIVCDVLFVCHFNMGAAGAAWATVLSQAISVVTSMLFISHMALPIDFKLSFIRFDKDIIKHELKLGLPLALQDLLVSFSFLIILAVVNRLGLIASAGMGVGEKVCFFIMLIPSALAQSMTAFVAQNVGAGLHNRCRKGLLYGIGISLVMGVCMFYFTFFHGDLMAGIFASDSLVIAAAHSYLKAYAIDCLLTAIMFCCVGYFNGYGRTTFCMVQGIASAFCIRTPLAIIFGSLPNTSLFLIGLSTPCSTFFQILMCLWMFGHMKREQKLLR